MAALIAVVQKVHKLWESAVHIVYLFLAGAG